jgi:UDP-galactopyranose mutase
MTRFAAQLSVIYWEEPLPPDEAAGEAPRLDQRRCPRSGVLVVTPRLGDDLQGTARDSALRSLLDELLADHQGALLRWYYTPMMLPFSRHLPAACTIYDCMDELANFRFAPPELLVLEPQLLAVADVVFTGGYSLWEAKRDHHDNIHAFPSSVDAAHFARARRSDQSPPDQVAIPAPRLGYYGVIDERMDLDLLAQVADARPDWRLVMVGPVVKIDPAQLPRRPNLHFLGGKAYDQLPDYLSGWDVAIMPFEVNAATRFISPTKTPEYLAGGRPVVSTAIADVVRHYGELDGVRIAGDAPGFVAACEAALSLARRPDPWRGEADQMLAQMSWARTHEGMADEIRRSRRQRTLSAQAPPVLPVVRPSRRIRPFDYLIVGAGFAGSVLAERLSSQLGKRVLLVDRRGHIGGNAYDEINPAGVLMHRYGPHIFHTNADDIFAYLSQFTAWRPYEQRLAPVPINRTTLNLLYGLDLQTDAAAEAYLRDRAEPVTPIRTSEDVVVSQVGRDLYETFFRGYTRKQWGLDPSELDRSVAARVPARFNTDDRYFTDRFQAMPAQGYTHMFENMLDQPGITLETGVEYEDVRRESVFHRLIFTGPIDAYFDHRFGPLPYRSLAFRHETLAQEQFQPVGTVNYPDEDVPYTRISEYKHMTGQVAPCTTITYEYPTADGEPYYPVPRPENHALYKLYESLARRTPEVLFVGRLASYRYYNMDQVTGQALAAFRRLAMAERSGSLAAEPQVRSA